MENNKLLIKEMVEFIERYVPIEKQGAARGNLSNIAIKFYTEGQLSLLNTETIGQQQ